MPPTTSPTSLPEVLQAEAARIEAKIAGGKELTTIVNETRVSLLQVFRALLGDNDPNQSTAEGYLASRDNPHTAQQIRDALPETVDIARISAALETWLDKLTNNHITTLLDNCPDLNERGELPYTPSAKLWQKLPTNTKVARAMSKNGQDLTTDERALLCTQGPSRGYKVTDESYSIHGSTLQFDPYDQ